VKILSLPHAFSQRGGLFKGERAELLLHPSYLVLWFLGDGFVVIVPVDEASLGFPLWAIAGEVTRLIALEAQLGSLGLTRLGLDRSSSG
jgi:hypothetical protein